MASPADSCRSVCSAHKLRGLLAPSSGRFEYATRQALICALTTLLVQLYQTPDPAQAVYLVFFLNRADRATSVAMNLKMVLLMSIVIGLVTLASIFVIDEPMWRVAGIAVLSFGFLFLTSASKLRPVGPTIALIVGYALDLLGTSPGGEVAARALLYSWLFVAMPAAVSIVVNLLIAPAPRRLVERSLARRLELSAAVLRGPNDRTRAAFDACIQAGSGEMPAWLKLAGAEKTASAVDLAALRHGMDASIAILLLVALISDNPAGSLPSALRERVAHVLEQMAQILRAGGYPIEIQLPTDSRDANLAEVPAALLSDLREALEHFAVPPLSPALPPDARTSSPFLSPDAFGNPEHVQYALKTTAAALFCYGLYVILDWPGIHTCFITCYVVALSTTAETVEKLTLRIAGCLVGAAFGLAAIVYLVPTLTTIGSLMAIVFLGAFAAAWVAGGSQQIAYAGFQIAFAFFLCVIQGAGPAFDLATARDRVIGILIGNLVAYLMFVYVWPVSIARRVDPAIGSLLRGLGELARTADLSGRRAIAAHTLSVRCAVERDLSLLAYEPGSARPSDVWRANRSQTVRGLAALTAPLLLAADHDTELASGFAHRLDVLADRLGRAPSTVPSANGEKAAPLEAAPNIASQSLWRLVNVPLMALEIAVPQVDQAQRTFDSVRV